MDSRTIIEILLALLALGVPVATFLAATHANRQQAKAEKVKAEVDARGVDALAYDRASNIWRELIEDLRTQIDRLETEVASLRKANQDLVEEVVTLRQANASLGGEVVSLRTEIAAMRNREGDK